VSAAAMSGLAIAYDERLVGLAQQGNSRAIAELVSRSRPRVRRFAHTLCRSSEDAEEAEQEALIVLYKQIGTLRVAAALTSWLFQVVRNECIRRSKIAVRLHHPVEGVGRSAEDVAIARLELARIAESIARLDPEQRAVLVLRDVEGLSGDEAAKRLGLTRAAMKSRLHRARESFRLQFAQDSCGHD
jgi:RNA polymerase sigma factor (sigma-70 family)